MSVPPSAAGLAPPFPVAEVGSEKPAPSKRLGSIDAYRGFVMLLMMGEVLSFGKVSRALPGNAFWAFLAQQQSHVAWAGCVLHDLIQPSFSFLVGVALPFSLARRANENQAQWQRAIHAFLRAIVLVLLGVFLRSINSSQTNWTFEDTLSQIGLGYGFLYLLALYSKRVQWGALIVLLTGYWLAFALYRLPQGAADFSAHWNLNTNAAWAFDTWFLNLFPRPAPFEYNRGGYSTLSFIPTLGTMLLGLLAGNVLRSEREGAALRLMSAGGLFLAAGWLLGFFGICPIVKRIWTPSWVLFSGGICFLFLAAFYFLLDVRGSKKWAFWLVVVGTNSIAAYLIAHLFESFISKALSRHLGSGPFLIAGAPYEPLLHGAAVLLVEWLVLFWMFRRKLFLRI